MAGGRRSARAAHEAEGRGKRRGRVRRGFSPPAPRGVRGGQGAPRQKTVPWNLPKSWVKILRTLVGRRGWRRRHENGAFDTEIFRRCGVALSVQPENGRKAENFKILKSEKFSKSILVQEKVKVENCPKSWVKILRERVGRRGWRRRRENGAFDTEIFRRYVFP